MNIRYRSINIEGSQSIKFDEKNIFDCIKKILLANLHLILRLTFHLTRPTFQRPFFAYTFP